MVRIVPVADRGFEQSNGWDFNHMLGEIGAELQGECTDDNWILDQKRPYGKNGTDGPLPDSITIRRRSKLMNRWQQRLALIVEGVVTHTYQGI